jgi:hypothetical protein
MSKFPENMGHAPHDFDATRYLLWCKRGPLCDWSEVADASNAVDVFFAHDPDCDDLMAQKFGPPRPDGPTSLGA